MTTQIPIFDPIPQYKSLKLEIHAAISRVLESGRYILGPEVKQFEEEVAAYLGVKHAIGVNSGTDALIIGLRALNVGPGDEVITTPFSFFATAESISNVGAKPVFVDIDPESFNIDPNLIEEKITPRTKAIMPVHLFGRPAAMTKIMAIAKAHNLKVIEDTAQAFGARYFGSCKECNGVCGTEDVESIKGKAVGTIGDVGAFSFFPTKNLGAYGDGGLITTDDDDIAELCQKLRSHGSLKKYHNKILGYNSRLDSIQAAILKVKLPYISKWNASRQEVAKIYKSLFEEIEGIITPAIVDGHVFHQYAIRVDKKQRTQLRQQLSEKGVSTMIYYPTPQDNLPIYQGKYPQLLLSEKISHEILHLPIWPEISRDQIQKVVSEIQTSLT